MSLQNGDRVVYVERKSSLLEFRDKQTPIGRTGVVCDVVSIGNPPIGVAWDDEVIEGHDCNGHANYGYGWYVYENELQLVDSSCDEEGSELAISMEGVV